MTQHIDPCETARVRVLAAALALQQCTKTACNIVPIPGKGQIIAIGTKADVARLLELEPAAGTATEQAPAFQQRVEPWMAACFGPRISADTSERNHRFFEEATELVQAGGMSKDDALLLVDYVYARPVGEIGQEVGGVMVTLAALCLANKMDMHQEAETELARIWTKVEQIRAKQASKPKGSALPMAAQAHAGHIDHDPIEELVDVIDVTPQPGHGADLPGSEGGHHD